MNNLVKITLVYVKTSKDKAENWQKLQVLM